MTMGRALSSATGVTSPAPMVVIGADNGRPAAQRAIEAIGGRVAAVLDWAAITGALGGHTACSALLVETEGATTDLLAEALPLIDAFAVAHDLPVVVSLDERSIDVVAATLMAPRTQMLCAPTIADRVVALAIAAAPRGAMPVDEMVREGESDRLQRLTEEVARIAEMLARLTDHRADAPPSTGVVSHPSTAFRHEPTTEIIIHAADVRRAIRARRLRDQHFGAGLFEDPAWDILLDLFAAGLEGAQVSVSSLCIAAAVAPTTALRWIAKLTENGLLERHPDPADRRRAFMALSSTAARSMREHVAALRRAGLPFG